ncbi:hypothetical protein FH966_05650 [Lentibacillus cibarius]|uniref:Uncharacterized protein n=1 Tax=Lentibacillus cibarius TaxID=2583219 RepID=A0A549YH81_9BACI|nr:permease prefix domain 1-containing protein [Lentibacillus cibarius]TRM11234.1 hypothetical protein FH966_05650 [Lentibacillus cibarius]
MNRLEKHVQKMLEQTQSANGEREELREELLSHLEEAKQHYMNEGLTEKQAEKRAIVEFGNSNNAGHQLQEAMYPYQRGLLYTIGMGSILFGVLNFMSAAFLLHDPIPIWLAIQFFTGSLVTLAAINISIAGRYVYLLHLVLFINVIWNGINLLSLQGSQWQIIIFGIYVLLLVGMGIVAIIRNSYYSNNLTDNKQQKRGLVLTSYVVNLLFGVAVVCVSLFFLWAFLFTMERSLFALLNIAPIIIWLIAYKFQMGHITKKPLISIITGFVISVFSIAIPLSILILIPGRWL